MQRVDWVKRLTGHPQPKTAEEAEKLCEEMNAKARERRRREEEAWKAINTALDALHAGKTDVDLKALHEHMEEVGFMSTTHPALISPADMLRFHQRVIRPLQPKQTRGRPRKAADAEPTQTLRSLDPALAERAYQLRLDGKSDRQICTALLPKALRESLSSEAARHRVRRLIVLGERIHLRKTPPTK